MSVIHVGPPTLAASRRAASPTSFDPVEPFAQTRRGDRPPPLVLNGAAYALSLDAQQVSLRSAGGAFEATHPEFLEELREMMRGATHALVTPGAAPPFVGVRWSALAQSTKNGLRAAMLGHQKDEAIVSVIVLAAAYVYELRDFPRVAAAYESVTVAMPTYDDVVTALRAGFENVLEGLDAVHESEALALVARAVTTYTAFGAATWAGTRVFRAITRDLDVPLERVASPKPRGGVRIPGNAVWRTVLGREITEVNGNPCGDEPIEWVAVGRPGRKYCIDADERYWNPDGKQVDGNGRLL
jgi:hypothetical protein